jgi:hypothetical protein
LPLKSATLRRAFIIPGATALEQFRKACGYLYEWISRFSAGLNQQNLIPAIGRQPVRQHAASRSRPDNDVINNHKMLHQADGQHITIRKLPKADSVLTQIGIIHSDTFFVNILSP